jgi:hypothetical protein
MFKKTVASLLLCAVAGFLFAADKAEIDTALLDKAYSETYINDKSPVSWRFINSGKQIRDMGRRLGEEMRYQEQTMKASSPYASGSPSFKYKVVRVYPGTKAGADVLYVAKNAGVSTIQNMRRVVSGYIEKAYGIPMDKADIIAKKVCYWNTNHYNDTAYFRVHFQVRVREVFSNRTSVIGLARSYKNWSGKTRIVIPFVLIQETVPNAVEPAAPQPETVQPETPQQDIAPVPETPAEPKPVVPAEQTVSKSSGLSPVSIILIVLLAIAVIVLIISLIKLHNNNKE